MNENVNVCITPKGDKPVLHFSQFDNERVFTVTVLADDGESAAVLTGLGIEFRLRKTDSHVVTIAPESVAANVITFKTTEQLCACCGQNIASVVLMKDDLIISTMDILVDIQRDILSGGLTSESDIRNLTTQIEQIVPEVIGDDYYNKQEVDDLLAEHTFDPTNYYTKSDVDALLDDKADSNDVYTKTETDNLLADKADSDDVYTKAEVNSLLESKADYPTNEQTGAITLINTTIVNPLIDLITLIQSSSVGLTECNIFKSRYSTVVNKPVQLYVDGSGVVTESSNIYPYRCVIAKVKQGDTYTYSVNGVATMIPVLAFFTEYPVVGAVSYNTSRIINGQATFTAPVDGYIFIRGGGDFNEVNQMVNIGSSVTPYEDPEKITISFDETLTQGGSLDVTAGVLTRTDTTTKQLIPTSITPYSGKTLIFSDTGDITSCKFKCTIDEYIDSKLGS